MNPYHKINSIFKRDMDKPNKPFIVGDYSDPAIEYLKDNQWEWTEKIDGTNIRIMVKDGVVKFGGKTDRADIPKHLIEKLYSLFLTDPCEKRLVEMFPNGACLYGEGFGYKIQGKIGIDYLGNDVDFYLFDIKVGDWWLKREDVNQIGTALGLRLPIIVGYGTIDEAIEYVRNGFRSEIGHADAEGLVLRPTTELFDRKGDRIITKVKTRDFI